MPTVRKYLENIVNRSMRPNDVMRDKEDAEAALKLISSSERVFIVAGEYDDYCCDCGTTVRLGDEPFGDWKAETSGRFILD